MKRFFVDLWDLQKQSWGFLKNHWKGYLVLFAVVEALAMGGVYLWSRKEDFKKTEKGDEEWN